MFYQNHSPEVVRRGNGMEFNRNGHYRESKKERSLKVTLLGYKVMEEKTKFTVYKILVMHAPDQSWVIYRRYTDFSQLHDKLKEMFPEVNFALPRKRWFNNFSTEFLEERKLGLQEFLQNLVANKVVTNSEAVRTFLCLGELPTEIDGLEERWAFGETNCHLKNLMESKCEIETMGNFLMHKELQISSPERTIIGTHRTLKWLNMQSTEPTANFLGEQEYKEVNNDDPKRANKSSELQLTRSHGACWSGSATDSTLTNIQNTQILKTFSRTSSK